MEALGKVMAGVASSAPPWKTRRVPVWRVISIRPSGVKASAVGCPTAVTSSSKKFGGSAAWAAGADRASEDRAMAMSFMVRLSSGRGSA